MPPNRLRFSYNVQESVPMSKNALGIWYEPRTMFRIGEFVAKVLNSSKVLSQIPIDIRIARTVYGLCESVKIFTNWVQFSHEPKYLSIRGIRGLCGIGVLMKVGSISECFWPSLFDNRSCKPFFVFLRVAVLHRFYCVTKGQSRLM